MKATIEKIIRVQRKVVNTVKLAPFIFALCYIITIAGYIFLPELVITILDTLMYVSPVCVALLLILSKQLGLCVWHRLECMIPIICMLPSLFDWTVCPLSKIASYINVILLLVLIALSFINAYFVFIKRCTD